MKEHPILFNTEMVKAILEGKKNQTRRVIKPQPIFIGDPNTPFKTKDADPKGIIKSPYGYKDHLLWVRETWNIWLNNQGPSGFTRLIKFHADDSTIPVPFEYFNWFDEKENRGYLNRPSIHVPKWAARIWLKVKDLRVERLQDISEEDAKAEGTKLLSADGKTIYTKDYRAAFKILWDSINGQPRKNGIDISWKANPWTWAVEFERTEKPK